MSKIPFTSPVRLSFEQLQKSNEEWQRNNTDMLSDDEDDTGYTAAEIIQFNHKDNEYCLELAARFGISDFCLVGLSTFLRVKLKSTVTIL